MFLQVLTVVRVLGIDLQQKVTVLSSFGFHLSLPLPKRDGSLLLLTGFVPLADDPALPEVFLEDMLSTSEGQE